MKLGSHLLSLTVHRLSLAFKDPVSSLELPLSFRTSDLPRDPVIYRNPSTYRHLNHAWISRTVLVQQS